MLTDSQLSANKKAQDLIDKQLETIKEILPPFPSTTNIFAKQPNKLYSKEKVKTMIACAIEFARDKDLDMEFEERCSDKGINTNNGENLDKYEEFMEDLINSFID